MIAPLPLHPHISDYQLAIDTSALEGMSKFTPIELDLPETPMNSRTCGIMINSKTVDRQVQQMTDVIRNKMLQTHVPKDEDDVVAEEDSVIVLVNECVNKHVEYILSGPPKENLGFGHYVKEYFPSVDEAITNDPTTMNYLEAKFAETTGILGTALAPAIEDLSFNGCAIDSIEGFAVGQDNCYYVLVGDNPDYQAELTEADGPHQPVPYNPEENPLREEARLERERELQVAMLPPEDRQAYLDDLAFGDYTKSLEKTLFNEDGSLNELTDARMHGFFNKTKTVK